MFTVHLGREYYHKQNEIFEWCTEQFGPYLIWDGINLDEIKYSTRWNTSSAFGHTYITFDSKDDMKLFEVQWVK